MKWSVKVGALALATLVGCGGASANIGSSGEGDAAAELACAHMRNVAADAADGLLTDFELREKLKEVHGDAQLSDEPGVATAARDMLSASTAGDISALTKAVLAMDRACDRAGY